MRLRRLAFGYGLVGIFVFQLVEREAAGVGDLDAAAEGLLVALEQARHVLCGFDVTFGIGFEAQARLRNRAFLADAGENVLQGAAMGRVIKHAAGGDERNAGARGELRQSGDAGAIVAAISVPRREIEVLMRPHRLLDTQELQFEIRGVMPAKAGIQ